MEGLKTANLPYLSAEYIPPTFWLEAPSPFCAGWRWGLLSRKIFLFFSILVWILVSTLFFRLSYLLISTRLKFVILYSILFFGISIVSTRCNFRSIFLICSSLCFTRINFDLFQHCRFYALTLRLFISLTLLLVINKHLCLCEFVLCLFWLF